MECCPPKKTTAELIWLPEPTLDDSGLHYKKYDVVNGTETTEDDRPSLKTKVVKAKAKKGVTAGPSNQPGPSDQQHEQEGTSTERRAFQSAQTARATVTCVECQKPRVIFSNKKLSTRQEMLLAVTVSEYEYSCGSTLFPPSCHNLIKELTINQYLSCQQPVEVSYYASDVGRKDLCCHCAGINAIVDPALKKQFKTVLPICDSCVADRKVAVTQRPFGKASKKRN